MGPSGDEHDSYWDELIPKFEKIYGNKPEIAVRCPGRVNLIGEHVDYSGFSVLPMAIKQSTYLLVRKNGTNKLNFANTDPSYENYSYDTTIEWLGTTKPKWYHYFLCGWKGSKEQLNISQILPNNGLDILLSGKIPPSAGLSSSSSLVCAAFLSTMSLDQKLDPKKIDRLSIADSSARVERYIGVEGGGMDQAIECLAEKGLAMKIDFNPLFFTKIILPKNAIFAVIHSGKTMNKASTNYYNIRVVECRLAAQIIAKRLNHHNWREIRTLRHLSEFLTKDPDEMIKVIERHFDEEYMDINEILSELEITITELYEYSLNETTKDIKKFKLRDRSLHVFYESSRVEEYKNACLNNNLEFMGKLMNLSHESCKILYECSCEELDETVEKCLNNGFIGARLTGAGWGGCVIALADITKKDEIDEKMDVLFWTQPSSGIQLDYL